MFAATSGNGALMIADRGQKVLKGGAFNSTNSRATLLPDKQVSNCGFRCILAATVKGGVL